MPLDPFILNSVVRITSAGDLLGTGSIVGVPSEATPERLHPYVITAHHVIKNQILIELGVSDPLEHGAMFPPIPCQDWWQPFEDVDLAIAPFPTGEAAVPRFQAVSMEQFLPENHVPGLGHQIYYLGVFEPLNVPMCRVAYLGALDIPISAEGYAYQGDLLDFRSYNGFSGSPCLMRKLVDADIEKYEINYLGFVTAHYSDEELAGGIVSRYGVGVMLPAEYIRIALMSDGSVEQRREWDRHQLAIKMENWPGLANLAADKPGSENSEFENFEALTRKLVQTPKPPRE